MSGYVDKWGSKPPQSNHVSLPTASPLLSLLRTLRPPSILQSTGGLDSLLDACSSPALDSASSIVVAVVACATSFVASLARDETASCCSRHGQRTVPPYKTGLIWQIHTDADHCNPHWCGEVYTDEKARKHFC